MGDRANIVVIDGYIDDAPTGVVLYTHWDGIAVPSIVKAVLSKRVRWGDSQYLTRMLFSAMIAEDIEGSTGYGISSYTNGDVNNDYLVVDIERQVVVNVKRLGGDGDEDTIADVMRRSRKSKGVTFARYAGVAGGAE